MSFLCVIVITGCKELITFSSMYISVDNENATFTYCYYEDVVTVPNICCET